MKYLKTTLAILLVTGFLGRQTHADEMKSLVKRINSSRATWRASENWVSQLPRETVLQMLGAQDVPDGSVLFKMPESPELLRSREVFDWRAKDGMNWVSPILNQGACGSCVAFASVATLETQMNVTNGLPGLNPRFSPQMLFACSHGLCNWGLQPEAPGKVLVKDGVPDEACAPYTMGVTGEDVPCNSICADAKDRSQKITGQTQPTNYDLDIDALRAAIRKGPVLTAFIVYEDFLVYSSGVYKHTTGKKLGGHAVSLVGYDDAARAWIVRNSWGEDWGDKGFFKISWDDDDSAIAYRTWQYNVAPLSGAVQVRGVENRSFVEGSVTLSLSATKPGASDFELNVITEKGVSALSKSCTTAPCTVTMDTKTLVDGKYELFATGKLSGQVIKSQHFYFYVLNQKPTLALNFKRQDGLAEMTPIKERIVFDIEAPSSPVPMSYLDLHVAKNGVEVWKANAPTTLPKMMMGWRTQTVSNGTYELWFTGAIQTNGQKYEIASRKATLEVKN